MRRLDGIGVDREGEIVGDGGEVDGVAAGIECFADEVCFRSFCRLEQVGVVAEAAEQGIVAWTAGQLVGQCISGEGVISGASDQIFEAVAGVELQGSAGACGLPG